MDKYELEMQKMYNDLIMKGTDSDAPKLPIVCPTIYGKPCRLCDLAKTILFKRDNEGSPEREKASSLNRKQSYYSNVILATNPSEIVVLQYGHSIWKELMLFQMGPGSEVTDWLDPIKGRNVVITKNTVPGNKRRTTYSVKTKINASPLLDMSVLRKLSLPEYQLDNVIELIMTSKIKPLYQSALQDGPNEIRFLPSWLGPGISKFFQQVLYHYGVTSEEFDLIQKGEYNPFIGVEATEEVQTPKEPKPAVQNKAKSMWEEYVTTPEPKEDLPVKDLPKDVAKAQVEEDEANYPPCFGKKYDPEDQECIVDCAQDGWADACKAIMEQSQKKLEKRKTAKRLGG